LKEWGRLTRTRKLIAGGALAGVLIALLAVPALINGDRYRSTISAAVEQTLGRKLSIDGPLSMALLPVPHLSAKAVRLANIDGAASSDMARLEGLDMRLRLLPLLAGRVEMSSLTLIAPQIQLEKLADGRVNWDFHPTAKAADTAPGGSAGAPLPTPSDGRLRLDKVMIESGVVLYRQPGRAPLRFDGIDANIALDSAEGPFRLSGTALFQDIELAADAQLGKLGGTQPLPVTLSLKLGRGAGDIRVSGGFDAAHASFKGKLTAKSADLPKLAGAVGISDLSMPSGPLAVEASLAGSGHEITADNLTVSLAGSQGSGNASLGLEGIPQVDMMLAFTKLDLDAWQASASKAEARAPQPAAPPIPAPPPSSFVLPKRISVNLDLSAQAVALHGGILRQAHLNAALVNGEIVLNQASVTLPGDSELNLFGVVGAEAGQPSFDGSFEAGTDDLRGLLGWFAIDVAAVPADRLHAARLVGKIAATPAGVKVDATQLRLDSTRIDAAADLRLGQPRPALGVSFAVDSFNLDAYWPSIGQNASTSTPPAGAAPPSAAVTAVATLAPAKMVAPILPAKSAGPSWFEGMDANVKGKVGQLVAHGATAQEVVLDATWLNGALRLRELSSNDVAGAQIKLSGGLASGPLRLQQLHYDLHSPHPARLLRLAGITPSFDIEKLGGVSLSGSLDGGVDLLTVDTHSEIAGTSLNITGKIENLLMAPALDFGVEASHSSLTQFVRLFAPDYHPVGALGAFAASTRVRGDLAVLQLTDLRLKAGPATVAGDARLSFGGKPRIDASLSAGEVTIDPFLPGKRSADARPQLRDMIENGLLIPTKGVPMRRAILASTGPEPTPPTAAPRPAVQATGMSEHWSHDPIELGWLRSFDAGLKLDGRAVTYGKTRFESVQIGLGIENGVATLERSAAQLYGGHLSGTGKLDAEGVGALQIALARAQMRDALLGVADMDMADGVMDGEANLTTSGHSMGEIVGRLNGTGKVSVQDGTIKGFDLKAVDQRLQNIDNPAGLISLFQSGLAGGATHFSSLAGTVRAVNGILTTDDLTLKADGGGAKATASINLPAYVMDGRAEFHLASAASAPPLTMRMSGPLDRPRRFVDINDIQSWLAQRFAGKLLKGKGLDAVKPQAQADQPAAPPEKVKAKDVLKGLLKGLH
jgi:uncharacterized protein involved in outer membrane biogenesis